MSFGYMIIIFAAILMAGFGLVFYFLGKKLKDFSEGQKNDQTLGTITELMKLTKEELLATRQEMRGGMDKNTDMLQKQLSDTNERLTKAAMVIGELRNVGQQMRDFQDFFKSPKIRGNLGEQVLKDLLEQFFPQGQFKIQYTFKTGDRVDAIIKTDKGIIPIDSKFPMENFQKASRAENEEAKNKILREFAKDVKKHVSDISKKYILPQEETVDFAIMYVPSETVYYEIIRNDEDLDKFAREKKIFIVSPNSFYYFLKVIMMGMDGKKIEEGSKKILESLNAIQKDSQKLGDTLGILNTHITNTKGAIDRVNGEYARLSGKIDNVRLLK